MTKCIATVGDVFVSTKNYILVEGVDKCDIYPYDDGILVDRALILNGSIYEDDGKAHLSEQFKCKPLCV